MGMKEARSRPDAIAGSFKRTAYTPQNKPVPEGVERFVDLDMPDRC
jgi:hypothetical protein